MSERPAAPKIVVYGPRRAPFTEKIALALGFKGLDAEWVEPAGPEDYRRWSPETGLLPAMDYDGTRTSDSSAILDWIEQRHPKPPLLSHEPRTARMQRSLEAWVGETFYDYWIRWVRAVAAASDSSQRTPAREGGELARLGILGRLRNAHLELGARAEPRLPDFARRLDDLERFLGDRPFFYAWRVSRADMTAVAFLRSLESGAIPDGERMLARRPTLVALMSRVADACDC
jgi:glutathione S-transferase